MGEDEISLLQELLQRAASEHDPERLGHLLALIESAARQEQAELKRKLDPSIQQYRAVERRKFTRRAEVEGKPDPAGPSTTELRYLKLGDAALQDHPPSADKKTS